MKFLIFVVAVQACLFQTIYGQCLRGPAPAASPSWNNAPYPGPLNAPFPGPLNAPFAGPLNAPFNSPLNAYEFGYAGAYDGLGYGPTAGRCGYGGSGVGNVAVAGELPVAGTTIVGGQVPILGAVEFGGTACAAGGVSITGSCGCGCGNSYLY